MKITATNPGMSSSFEVDYEDFTLKSPKQIDHLEPRTLDLTLPRGVPVTQFAQVMASEQGLIQFRGYVETYQINDRKEKTLSCKGMEALLNQRYAHPYFYPIGTKFSDLYSDACADLALPGLLAQANGGIPPGLDYSLYSTLDVGGISKNIVKITNGGKLYRFSTRPIYAMDYRYLRKLDEAEYLADLAWVDNAFFRDDNNIYIRRDNFYDHGWKDLGGIIIENAFDTTCRLDVVDTKALAGDLPVSQSEREKIGDLVVDIAMGHKYYVHFRDDENFTYIKLDAAEGR
jgi:hypothetical protein